jgi:Arc/MetJ-type ribon-helix-helix transcriptional regulator
MARERLSISLPPAAMLFVKARVDIEGYGSVSEYFRELVRLDQRLELDRQNAAARLSIADRGTYRVAGLPQPPKW